MTRLHPLVTVAPCTPAPIAGHHHAESSLPVIKTTTYRFQISSVLFQDEIIEHLGEEVFELGLLMAMESEEGEQTQVFGFSHQLFQEFTAGKFVATADKVIIDGFRGGAPGDKFL